MCTSIEKKKNGTAFIRNGQEQPTDRLPPSGIARAPVLTSDF